MKVLVQYAAVGAGGVVGAMLRFFVANVCNRWFIEFPVGTMVINVTGSLFLGWFLTITAGRLLISDTLKFAIATGFVGAYTTFSTYMWESDAAFRDRAYIVATINIVGSVVLGLLAVRCGVWLATK